MLKLYCVTFDGQPRHVEANSFGHAITLWHVWAKKEWGKDYEGTEEPDSVALVHDEPVVRERSVQDAIEILRGNEGSSVTISASNAEGSGWDNEAVEVQADWTDWKPRHFMGTTLDEALDNAVAAMPDRCKAVPAAPANPPPCPGTMCSDCKTTQATHWID